MGWTIRALAAAILAAVLVTGCAAQTTSQAGDGSAEPEVTTVTPPDGVPLLGYELPLDVATLEESLGQPNSIVRPNESDESPWGQWLAWDLPDGTVLRALADDYDPASSSAQAETRYIELGAVSLADSAAVVTVPVMYGFTLNASSIQDVDSALPTGVPSMMHERLELDPDDVYHATILYQKDALYTYFFFDESGTLVAVGQATYYMDGAD